MSKPSLPPTLVLTEGERLQQRGREHWIGFLIGYVDTAVGTAETAGAAAAGARSQRGLSEGAACSTFTLDIRQRFAPRPPTRAAPCPPLPPLFRRRAVTSVAHLFTSGAAVGL